MILDGPGEALVIQPVHKADDPPVFGFTCGAEFVERLEQDRIQPVRRPAPAGKPLHPYPVGDQEMVEHSVDRFEERAPIGAILFR